MFEDEQGAQHGQSRVCEKVVGEEARQRGLSRTALAATLRTDKKEARIETRESRNTQLRVGGLAQGRGGYW